MGLLLTFAFGGKEVKQASPFTTARLVPERELDAKKRDKPVHCLRLCPFAVPAAPITIRRTVAARAVSHKVRSLKELACPTSA